MIRVDVETILMAAGPVPSVIVLRERTGQADNAAPSRSLSIHTGSFEAASVGRGMDRSEDDRPLTHDLLAQAVKALGAKVERIEIDRVDAPVFFASVVLGKTGDDGVTEEVRLDARPSDAIALAVRVNAPMFVEDDVMNRAGTVSRAAEMDETAEYERFDQFVQNLSPDDF